MGPGRNRPGVGGTKRVASADGVEGAADPISPGVGAEAALAPDAASATDAAHWSRALALPVTPIITSDPD